MKRLVRQATLALMVGSIVLATAALLAQRGPGGSAEPLPLPKAEEFLLFGNSLRGAGEPMVAVDPSDPRHVIAVAMGNLHVIDGKHTTGNSVHHGVANSTINWLAVSHDGGQTFAVREQPILSGKLTRCPDAIADVMKDGTFLAGCEPRETASGPDYFGMSALMVSRDHGESWGPVVQLISDYELNRFAPGLRPVSGGFPKGAPNRVASNSPWDRPYTEIDDSSGVIYAAAQGGSAYADESGAQRRSQAYITASTDGGKNFGTVYSWDSPEYVQSSRGVGQAAAFGVVAVVFTASKVPASEGFTCPCPVWGLSRDRGKTFTYHVLKHLMPPGGPLPAPAPAPPPPGAAGRVGQGSGRGPAGPTPGSISADHTKAGRFAMLKTEGPRYSIAVSEDYGRTWGPYITAGTVPDAISFTKPRFEFSRDGVIGLMWRAVYADRSYDIWASISRDSGRTYSKPLRVSHAKSPARDAFRDGGGFGDDIQDLSMDKQIMHLVWGDSRAGFQGVWYGRVQLSTFEF
ncbi:MAG: hypothetical protein NTV05_08890 [Acidobacteria bacterium]|nr:hypothetical protein [Acidobacteriota bacterium]